MPRDRQRRDLLLLRSHPTPSADSDGLPQSQRPMTMTRRSAPRRSCGSRSRLRAVAAPTCIVPRLRVSHPSQKGLARTPAQPGTNGGVLSCPTQHSVFGHVLGYIARPVHRDEVVVWESRRRWPPRPPSPRYILCFQPNVVGSGTQPTTEAQLLSRVCRQELTGLVPLFDGHELVGLCGTAISGVAVPGQLKGLTLGRPIVGHDLTVFDR